MILGNIFLAWFLVVGRQSPTPAAAKPSDCGESLAGGMSGAGAEICLGEEARRLADAAHKGSPERSQHFQEAEQHYRRAANATSNAETRARALNSLADIYDAQRLNEPGRMDGVLRELIALQPEELMAVFRLAKLQEDRGLIEAAEDTLLGARHQKPDAVEPYKMLAQFYARRATAMHGVGESQKPATPTSAPGEPDDKGIYRVGGAVTPPQRLDRAVYPPEALAAGIEGAVIAEVVVNQSGDVIDARVVRSVPLLDEEALRTARNWHFAPTIVNGQPVPIRMTVTVNFTTR